jgi:hypothetical protein
MLQLSLLPSLVLAVNVTVVMPTGKKKLISCELEISPTVAEAFNFPAKTIELLPLGRIPTTPEEQVITGVTESKTGCFIIEEGGIYVVSHIGNGSYKHF